MKLLLDTHIFVWAFLEPDRILRRIRDDLENVENTLYLSPITVWEILILAEKKRLRLLPDPLTWLRRRVEELAPIEATLTVEAAYKSREIEIENDDPADRFLAATAAVLNLILVTADERLIRGKGYSVLPNR